MPCCGYYKCVNLCEIERIINVNRKTLIKKLMDKMNIQNFNKIKNL